MVIYLYLRFMSCRKTSVQDKRQRVAACLFLFIRVYPRLMGNSVKSSRFKVLGSRLILRPPELFQSQVKNPSRQNPASLDDFTFPQAAPPEADKQQVDNQEFHGSLNVVLIKIHFLVGLCPLGAAVLRDLVKEIAQPVELV
jgi:hypothetical protein